MMNNKQLTHKTIVIFIATVWIVNGLFCNVLYLVPRHQNIVERIIGHTHAELLTKAIGMAEILMAVWILSRIKSRVNAMLQIIIILIMNGIEFILAPDLLLWGRANIIFAFLFIVFIHYNEFRMNKQQN